MFRKSKLILDKPISSTYSDIGTIAFMKWLSSTEGNKSADSPIVVKYGERQRQWTYSRQQYTGKLKQKDIQYWGNIQDNGEKQRGRIFSFADSTFGLKIKNLDNGESYTLFGAQEVNELITGQSRNVAWQQENSGKASTNRKICGKSKCGFAFRKN